MTHRPERRGRGLINSIPQESRTKVVLDAPFEKGIPKQPPSPYWRIEKIGSTHMELIKDTLPVSIPLALVEAVWPSNHFSEYTISLRATFVKGEKGGMTVRLGRAR